MMKAILRIYSEAYRGFPREVWMLCAVLFVNRTGSMVLAFLTLYLTKALGYSLGTASQVLAVYGCGYLAGGLVGGWLCDRLGALRILFLSLALSGLGFFVLERLRSLPAIMVTTFLVAVAAESFNPANLSALAAFSTPGRFNRVVALNRGTVNLAVALAPAIGGWLVMRDYALIFWVEGTAGLAAAALLAFLFRNHAAKAQPASKPAPSGFDVHPLRDGVFLAFLGLNFLAVLISMQVLSTFPVYLTQVYGMAESHFGLLMTLNGLLILLFEMVITHCTEAFRPLTMVGAGAFLIGLGFAILPLGSTMLLAAVSVVVWTTGEMLGTPAAGGWVASRAGTHRGKYMGLYSMTWGLGWIVAPPVGAFLYQVAGPESLWLAAGMLGGLAWAGFELLRRFDRRIGAAGSALVKMSAVSAPGPDQ
ncbi:MAG TPA: MFS transporter [Thermoanaerobaculia bacterium]|nr:MFS transporter [Thermoanaerobaculia bacterium]